MSESKSSLIDQFSQAIQSVKDRITGYNGQVKQYKQGVNANADRLRELVDKLRNCLEGLKNLKCKKINRQMSVTPGVPKESYYISLYKLRVLPHKIMNHSFKSFLLSKFSF